LIASCLFFELYGAVRSLLSFPTRRSSDLLAALVLFADFAERLKLVDPVLFQEGAFRLNDPIVLIGLLVGAMLPFLFSAFLMESVDRKSTRLNSSHVKISYAVFCLKKKNQI